MKAATFKRYGPPEVLEITDVPTPQPGPEEVLVRVHITAINDYDWSMVRGKPYLYRLMFGLTRPKITIPGMELSGTVEAVGEQVTGFNEGDRVYGDTSEFGFGTFAEYVSVNQKALSHIPEPMTYEEAASISHAAMLAYQGLFDIGKLQSGQSVLINGAGGGVGTFALQMAKLAGASEVSGVDTGQKLSDMANQGLTEEQARSILEYFRTL